MVSEAALELQDPVDLAAAQYHVGDAIPIIPEAAGAPERQLIAALARQVDQPGPKSSETRPIEYRFCVL